MAKQSNARSFWWLNPCWIFVLLALIPALSAYQISDAAYQLNWRSGKYFFGDALWLVVQASGCFLLGSLLTVLIPLRSGQNRAPAEPQVSPQSVALLYKCYQASAWLTLFGYLTWFAFSAMHGLSPRLIWDALRGDPGVTYVIREMMETIPGVTTCTQFGMATFILGTFLGFRMGWHRVRRMLIAIALLALLRALIRGERLALIELLLPALVIVARMRFLAIRSGRTRGLMLFAPIFLVALLYAFFTASEYSRSWASFYADKEESLAWFGWTRLVGYYVTALNNGAVHYAHVNLPLPDSTIEWFWKFPGIKVFLNYKSLIGNNTYDEFGAAMLEDVNLEFNNISGLFVVFSDYGHAGGLIMWTFLGMIAMALYRSFMQGRITGLLLYPMYFLGILEAPRIFYWGSSRAFPSWMMLFMILAILIWKRTRVRAFLHSPLDLRYGKTQEPHQTPP